VRALAQIGDAIVYTLSIPVIDRSARVLTMSIKPGEPMREVAHSVYVNHAVSIQA
jgi:hypothetical protein